MGLRFPFHERKAAQAAAHLLRLSGGRLAYMHLIKLLYLADREMLIGCGRPITGDRLVSMKHGPVLGRVLDFINSGPTSEQTPWFEYISEQDRYDVSLKDPNPDVDELSEHETTILDEVHRRYGSMDKWELVDLLHKILPEWKDPGSSSSDIDPEEILRAAHWDDARLKEARVSAEEELIFARIG
jgi:uncharacterized phage-associated protein